MNALDAATQQPAQSAEQRYGREKGGHDDPVHRECVDDDEDDADERRENEVDGERDKSLDVGPHLLELTERFTAALILKHGIGQLQRMSDAVRVHLGADALYDHVDIVVLEILGNTRHESDAHCQEQQCAGAFDERRGLILAKARRVVVDHVPEDERIEKREDLVRRRQQQREENQRAVFTKVGGKEIHTGY